MRIIYAHTDPFPSPMAGSVFVLNTMAGIAQAGHEATLIVPDGGMSVNEALRYYGVEAPESLRIILAKPQRVKIGPLGFNYSPRFFADVARRIRESADSIDAVIVRTLTLANYLLRQRLPVPIFFEMHDWYGDLARKWEGASWMITPKKLRRERKLESIERVVLPETSGVICLRKATMEIVARDLPDLPLVHAATGLNAPDTLPAVSDEPVVVYVGQLHPHKGLDVLFQAAATTPDLRFLIVGGGEWLDHWKKRAEELGISSRIEFSGHVPRAEVEAHLARGRVGVLPLLDCFFNRYLTSPVKIMEYLAAGLPVVTADAPVTREIVEHEKTGLLVPFGDAEALGTALARLCRDSGLHQRCRDKIAKRLPEMSWLRRGEVLARFIESVVRENGARHAG
jgi:glycosyltransferase involved in cell wall biosynthesis